MDIPEDLLLSMKNQLKSVRDCASRLGKMVQEIDMEIDMLERQIAIASHPAGKRLAPIKTTNLDATLHTEVDHPTSHDDLDIYRAKKENN